MPATTTKLALQTIRDKLVAMGGVSGAIIGEPKGAVENGLVCVIPEGGRIDSTVLNAPRELHEVTLRRHENALQQPFDLIDETLDNWRAEILEDIFGEFDLGGNVAYIHPAETHWEYGYITLENTLYRVVEITIVFRVDPTATFAP